ncbi:PTS sugar transporter subunit IIC [uncultured Fusobacterium sp.]|uniref:PTS sugar transporter subunit IIC n=1 Tax=uncultured Fusobacterium sp. TaxID=159267 RepID=UPI0025FF739E|nr:PTS sugar transporter subunit IIC [uncultured Fusobacterium sp.]
MSKAIEILEEKLVPVAAWIAENKYVNGIRRAFIMMMPLLMIGSLFLMITAFPLPAYQRGMASLLGENWKDIFDIPVSATFNLIALFVAFLVAQQLAKQFELDSIAVGLLSLASFLILTPLGNTSEFGQVITFTWLGSKGMFVAMVIGVVTVKIFHFFVKRDILVKMPDGVPPEVIKSFEALIPGTVILATALLLRVGMEHTSYGTIHDFVYKMLALPLRALGTSYIGSILTVFAISILWSVGINSGSMVNGFVRPFWLENQAENIAALQAGQPLPHVITEQFFDMIWMGGAGVTLSLLLAIVIFAKSKHIKSVGAIGIVPGIFNINEPVLFGLPIILNPIMLIPFNIVPIVMVTTQYIAMNIGLVSKPLGVAFPWPTPAVISGFITVGDFSGALIQIANLIIGAMIYLPFLRIIDKASKKEEDEMERLEAEENK